MDRILNAVHNSDIPSIITSLFYHPSYKQVQSLISSTFEAILHSKQTYQIYGFPSILLYHLIKIVL